MALNLSEHLQNVLETYRMKHIDNLFTKYKSKRDEIKVALEQKYSNNIYSPFNSGSYAKHTAINSKFDLDIVVPFKRNSFSTLEAMFEDVYNFLEEEYKEVAIIRRQKVSIGVIFNADRNGDIVNIDIVPGRELNQDEYKDTKDLNLYFNEGMGLFSKNSYIKTNIQAQIDNITSKENERKIIRLLKIWKISNSVNYKSFLIELITIKAFEKVIINGNLWEKLKCVMEYIRDNITKEDFKLIDPGNSNNNIIDTLEIWERTILSNKMDLIIKRIEENNDDIRLYFPENKDFTTENRGDDTYEIKNSKVIPSIPTNFQRFG